MSNKKEEDNNTPEKEIINYALKELEKTFKQSKTGKQPKTPQSLKNIYQVIKETQSQLDRKQISEEQMQEVMKELAKNLKKE